MITHGGGGVSVFNLSPKMARECLPSITRGKLQLLDNQVFVIATLTVGEAATKYRIYVIFF